MRLTQIVEALLFASDAPLGAADIARIDERLDEDTVEAVIQELRSEYEDAERAFQIYEVAGGYQMLTRPDYATFLERYETIPQPARLSGPGLETLAIIAYRQPIGRAEIEEIRGVGSAGALKTLVERGLAEVVARGEGLGRPLLYGSTKKFLEHFGFRSLEDLPRPEELPVVLRTRPATAASVATAALEAIEVADGAGGQANGTHAAVELPPGAEPAFEMASAESESAPVRASAVDADGVAAEAPGDPPASEPAE